MICVDREGTKWRLQATIRGIIHALTQKGLEKNGLTSSRILGNAMKKPNSTIDKSSMRDR